MQPTAAFLALFDRLPDVVFFCKDVQGRYTHGNRTLLERLGLQQHDQLRGKTAGQLFPPQLGGSYWQQDLRVIRTGHSVVNELERHAGLSVAQLERHVAALMQLTPSRWLLWLRLDAAIRQLEQDLPIAHVAADCGFADHSAFTRAFRRHVGLSPSAYRQLRQRT